MSLATLASQLGAAASASGPLLAQAGTPVSGPEVIGIGETIAFWILGPLALAGALGMVFARNAVHSALWLVLTMLSLGVVYMVQQAPFLGIVQIIVYTGAIMMLFLFVLMLVGRDSADSVVEVIRGQRLLATLFGVGFAVLVVGAVARSLGTVESAGLGAVNAVQDGNVTGLGNLLFTDYVFPFELTGALLVVATVGALMFVLADKRSAPPRKSQREQADERFRGDKPRVSPLPGPGVFATANSVAVPALLPDGSVAPESLSEIIESTAVRTLDADRASVAGGAGEPGARALTTGSPEDADAEDAEPTGADAAGPEAPAAEDTDRKTGSDTGEEEGRA
ncbi:NADH-quinone oxidoreductase subunit J [Actinoalloteichus sp. AHMU CJ021]|uniref:NADH-quinone oxidoreductase subunit J n=1 Tax=Actinoalloteichus caeruleus DSM 43889 TaxID=1120930 RepID=A0ABT1JLG9_ACTCY|nr:NADH-quinone oxidoreductase subunit J [Actinoalloteichus sp. AHMU CJ021]MCP2333370.1 NADH dehydrogenase subunit J (EC 1.6.5.3) [Actinoalloteichus caeruleus DSM 43889]